MSLIKKKVFSWPFFSSSFHPTSCLPFAAKGKNCQHLSLIPLLSFSPKPRSVSFAHLPNQNCMSSLPLFLLLNPKGPLSVLICLDAPIAFELAGHLSPLSHFPQLSGHQTLWFSSYPTSCSLRGHLAFPPPPPPPTAGWGVGPRAQGWFSPLLCLYSLPGELMAFLSLPTFLPSLLLIFSLCPCII